MRKIIQFILICFLVFISCRHTKTSKIDNEKKEKVVAFPYFIDLENNLNNLKTIPLSSIGKKIEYIPLETTSKSILRKIKQIEFSDSYIFINDFDKVLQFDQNGNFIRQIGSNGKGPGEYISVSGFCIDNKKEKVYIITWGVKLILEFDFTGKFIRSFRKPFESTQFLVKDTNSLVFHLFDDTNLTNDSGFNLYITDLNGTPLVKVKKYYKRKSKPGYIIGETTMYLFNEIIHFQQFGVDTLYTLKNEKLEPYAIFNLGKMKMDHDPTFNFQNNGMNEVLDQLKQKLTIKTIGENKNYLFLKLNFGLSDSSKFCIFSKQTEKTTFLENKGFINDLDGGLAFWPRYLYKDSILVDYCEPNVLLNNIRSGNSEELKKKYGDKYFQLERLEKELTEISNPILIILK